MEIKEFERKFREIVEKYGKATVVFLNGRVVLNGVNEYFCGDDGEFVYFYELKKVKGVLIQTEICHGRIADITKVI